MRLGLISDTHGHVERTIRAASLLRAHHVDAVIHCGDIGSPDVLRHLGREMNAQTVPIYAVTGNVDRGRDDMDEFVATGVHVLGVRGDLHLAQKALCIIHGDDRKSVHDIEMSEQYDYVFTGHTHQVEDRVTGRTRTINPGAIFRANIPTCATLQLLTGDLTIIPLGDST